MSIQQEKENGLILNIPYSIKKEIKSAFPNYTENKLNKVCFFVYKICKEGNYQINIRNHSDMLGLSTGEVTHILSKLRTMLIITTDGDYRIGAVSNSYRLMKKYDCESEDNYKVFYYPSKMKMPIWVQQYIYDGYTVYSKEFSKYRNNKKSEEVLTYDGQSKLIKKLETEIASLNAQLSQSSLSVVTDEAMPVVASNEACKHNADDTFIINEDGVTITVTNAGKLMDYLSTATEKSKNFIKTRILGGDTKRQLVINDCYNKNHLIYGVKTKVGDDYFFEVTRV